MVTVPLDILDTSAPNAPGETHLEPLEQKSCSPCRGGTAPLTVEQIAPYLEQVANWEVDDGRKIMRGFPFKDFATALAFTNVVGALAEKEGHHPDIHLAWGRVSIEIWTHKIDGLTESDFILAAKIDAAHSRMTG